MNENPALYAIAKKITHEAGLPYTDPRTGETTEPETPHRVSRVINRDYVRRWALEYCREHTLPSRKKFVRVSDQFLNMIEAATKSAIIHRIESHSPKGKTLQ